MTTSTPCKRQQEFYKLYFATLDPPLADEDAAHVRCCDYCHLAKESGRRDHYKRAEYKRAHPEHVSVYSL